MKEELQKQRDELADKLVRQYQMPFDPAFIDCVNYYKDGFDACYSIMNKDIEALRANNKELADQRFELMEKYAELEKRLHAIKDAEQTTKELQSKLDVARKALELSDKWYNEIYPEEVFIGGTEADRGVNRVVELRTITRQALKEME